MVPWIQVYSNLPSHPKTARLAEELKLKSASVDTRTVAAGMVVSLWCWAIQNAWSGDLGSCSDRAIADACAWRGKPEILVSALCASGFLDPDRRIHDWEDYAILQLENEAQQRRKTKERVARFRALRRKKALAPPPGDKDAPPGEAVDETPPEALQAALHEALQGSEDQKSNAPTEQNGTALSSRSSERNVFIKRARDFDAQSAEMTGRRLFAVYGGRHPTENDLTETTLILRAGESEELLEYAFREANRAGRPGNWNYIHGVLANLAVNGIATEEEAENLKISLLGR